MEENLLLEAAERYRRGEMDEQEKVFFEELRKTNPEIDQTVAEHMMFLQEMEKMSDRLQFRHNMTEVESKLMDEGFITQNNLKGRAKVIYMWGRYRRSVAVAATIAVLVSVFTAFLVSTYSENKKQSIITPLVNNKLNQFEHKLNQIEYKLNTASKTVALTPAPKFKANFSATGFLADGKGYIITNAHVVDNAKNLVVENKKGVQFYAQPVYTNEVSDLAILKITDTSFKRVQSLPYTFSKNATDLGEQIFTLGYPREEVVYSEGYLSAKSGYSGDTTSYQVSISVNPGNSGGPVINRNGEIIGIISGKETNADGVVFAIKSDNIYSAIKDIKSTDTIRLPQSNSLKGTDRVQQIKKLEDYIYMVKGN